MRGLRIYHRRLPHWRLDGATYFVTWRLHRSQPALMVEERIKLLAVIRYSDGQMFDLHAAVVMDDHIHVVLSPRGEVALAHLVRNWKACGAAALRRHGRGAPFWQREYHAHLIRSPGDRHRIIRYVVNNPMRRWPGISAYAAVYVSRADAQR